MHYPLQPPSWSEIYMGNANWTFIIIKIMISVVSTVIIKMKDENNAKRTLYSLFAVNREWKINSVLVCRVGVPDRDRGGHVQEVVLPKTSEFAQGSCWFYSSTEMKKADTECNHFLLLGAVLKTDVTNEVLFIMLHCTVLAFFRFPNNVCSQFPEGKSQLPWCGVLSACSARIRLCEFTGQNAHCHIYVHLFWD